MHYSGSDKAVGQKEKFVCFLNVRTYNLYDGNKKVQFHMNPLKTRSDVKKLRKSKLSLGRRIGIRNFSVLRNSCSLVGRYRSFGPPHFFSFLYWKYEERISAKHWHFSFLIKEQSVRLQERVNYIFHWLTYFYCLYSV